MKYLVRKPLPADGDVLQPGTVVDAQDWRNLRTLISGRYLEPYAEQEAPKKATKADADLTLGEVAAPASKPKARKKPVEDSQQ